MSLKILILEDVAYDAELIQRQLTKEKVEFTAKCVSNKKGFIEALNEFDPDVILSDHSLPGFDSLSALEIAKEKKHDVCFILVTGTVSEEFAVTCIKSGADDYILKSNLARLPSAIKTCLEKKELQTENIIIKRLNDEIEKKNKELEYLNNEKDRFVGMVSHDLQNYVSVMTLAVGLLEKQTANLTEHQLKYINRIGRGASNMYRLINDFLTINRIQQGIINPAFSPVEVGKEVEELIEKYDDIAANKKLKITYSNTCNGFSLPTDKGYFGIITDNLISNAVKYSPKGGEINISISKTGDQFSLEVKDQGAGIPESELPKLYQRFQKLSPRPTNGETSNGLGLSIVKDLVEALNGSIECKSKVGEGTTFTVLL